MKKYIIPLLAMIPFVANAQNENDAMRYSATDVVGTARYQSLGGAFTAIGVDMTTAATNPAGIAASRSSQFQITPAIFGISSSSKFDGNSSSDFKLNLNVGNWGFIGTVPNKKNTDVKKGLQSVSFGLTYTRMNNFHQNFVITNPNSSSSLTDSYVQNLNGVPASSISTDNAFIFGENLAYQAYLINPDSTIANDYTSVVSKPGNRQLFQGELLGRIGETNFTLGGNWGNKLYFGGGVGISRIRYNEKTNYTEADEKKQINGFDNFNFNRRLSTQGTGYNFKVGIIYRPNNFLRLGASVISPSIYNLSDNWVYAIASNLDTNSYSVSSPSGSYNYTLFTAPRFNGGLAFIFGSYGLFSIDYELINYNFSRLRANDYSFLSENQATCELFRSVGNIRMGTEWKVNNISLRAGAVLFASPYKNASSYFNRMNFSGGIGYMGKRYFCDVTYVFSTWENTYTLYQLKPNKDAVADIKTTSGNFIVSFGVKF